MTVLCGGTRAAVLSRGAQQRAKSYPNCTSAQTPRKYYYVVAGVNGVTTDDVKAFYALAMFAMAQEKPLAFIFDVATSNCYISAVKFGE